MRRSILACGLVLGLAGISTAAAATGPHIAAISQAPSSGKTKRVSAGRSRPDHRALAYWSRHIRRFQAGARRWLLVIRGRPPHALSRSLQAHHTLPTHSVRQLRKLALRWRHREHNIWRRANHPPDLAAWLCIHHYEGSWADSGAPYWGGLQMNLSFQATYGGWLLRHKGTADHWSPLEQIWTAVRAWRVRGFSPWPSTAHACGVV